jgi:Tol biopolymer transport system component
MKYILIVVILAVLVIGGILFYQYQSKQEVVIPEKQGGVTLEKHIVTIKGLIEKGFGKGLEGAGGPGVQELTGYFISLSLTDYGVIALNDNYSKLYLIEENKKLTSLVSTSPNHLTDYVASPDRNLIGFKLIEAVPQQGQSPVVYSLSPTSRDLVYLMKPNPSTGGATFSKDKVAFTVGNKLYISDYDKDGNIYPPPPGQYPFDLGAHLNLEGGLSTFTPISPDGQFVIIRDADEQLWIVNFKTWDKFQFTDGKMAYFNPVWSFDGKKVAYQELNGWLMVYNLNTKTTYSFGNITTGKPSWSPDSEYLIFHLSQIEEGRKFINSDLFLAKFDGSEIIQLTDTKDRFEIDPSFSKDGKRIVFGNYVSGGEIYTGEFENLELKGIERLYP